MKAAVLETPRKIVVREVPDPVVGGYDVLCDILACSVCSGTDRHLFHNDPYFKVQFPTILGHEAIGRVTACGPKVKNLNIGDLVTRIFNKLPEDSGIHLHWGGFAQKGVATDWQAMRADGLPETEWRRYTVQRVLPTHFSPAESTLIITWRETHSFLKRLQVAATDKVVIIGSGANALAFVKHSHNLGVETLVIGSPKRSEHFRRSGANSFVSYREVNQPAAMKALGWGSADVVIDAIGDSSSLNKVLPLTKSGVKLGVYGLDNVLDYHINTSLVKGDFSFYSGEHYDEASVHDDIIALIEQGKLNAGEFISPEHIYPLAEIEQAFAASWSGEVLKSVVVMER
ncbi:hypothetical protein A2477_03915 [Candidatus Falkowbacteria bacterium RIFOXYC2_FULL_47_12]|uniref:Alcohol dehydrogenase-like N-terminal domain-containing protein n=1 Tax=Candidatus Falkowbacteria bacterium RIFOXYC2_FULL_47_12 TaxID=1798004 RepID=A0A1F5TQ21_9BACT|nr:MAG: hypothetical protein A2477_03915 [Candidatus Falkowbacteria bacterium RIFOXYC2_FULL_47_12]